MLQGNITETIAHTPLVKLNRISADLEATIALKCEFFNPAASVKDRIGAAMIADAEARGVLVPGATIIEPTSGNTGIGLAMVAAARGYRLILTMPESMSLERRRLLALLGAELVLTPASLGMAGAIARARKLLAATPDSWMPDQFSNPANPAIHERTTAQEIWQQTDGLVDILVSAVGTGGTFSGCMSGLRTHKPSLKCYAVEPAESPVIAQTLAGETPKPTPHKIQGIGAGFIPQNFHYLDAQGQSQMSGVLAVTGDEAISMARRLAREEGILAGISSGANVHAAIQLAKRPENRGKYIVTFACDTGERYLTTELANEQITV